MVVLTDGEENNSQGVKKEELINRALKENVTISTAGIGEIKLESYLKSFEQTGGTSFFNASASKIPVLFEKSRQLLEKELTLSYRTKQKEAPGIRKALTVKSAINEGENGRLDLPWLTI